MSNLRSLLAVALILFAMLIFSAPQTGVAQEGTPQATTQPTASDNEMLIRLEGVEKRADSAVQHANDLLNIFQIIGAAMSIIGVVFAAGAVWQWQQFSGEWRRIRNEYFGNAATNTRGKFQELTEQVTTRFDTMQQAIDATGQFKTEGEATLRAMRAIEQSIDKKLDDLQAIARKQNEALALAQLGQQQIIVGNLSLATGFYEQAYALDNDNEVLRFFLGDLYVRQEKLTEGIALLEESTDYAPARLSLAYAKRLLGDRTNDINQREKLHGEAQTLFSNERDGQKGVVLLDITGESAFGALAGLYKRQGRHQLAYDIYLEAERWTPQNSYPVTNLGILAFKMGNPDAAREHFKRSLTLAERKITRDADDHYAWHDRITAKVVLAYALDEILVDLDEAFNVTPGIEPLRKLEKGLRDLAEIKDGPRHDEQIARRIQAEIARREAEIRR